MHVCSSTCVHNNVSMQCNVLDTMMMAWLCCRYAPKYVKEYVDAVSLDEALHLGEFWVDMRYDTFSSCQCILPASALNLLLHQLSGPSSMNPCSPASHEDYTSLTQ